MLTDEEREALADVLGNDFPWLGDTMAAVERIVTARVSAALREAADVESVIDAIEETFLPQLPTKALSYCAQEDVNAGLDALRERFQIGENR